MIFIDSNVFIALRYLDHPLHEKALKISSRISEPLVTTNIVISETLTVLSMRVSKLLAIQFGKDLQKQDIQTVYIDHPLHEKAWEIFRKIKNKNISFFDCTSFAVMQNLKIRKAFSFDRDFQKYGYELENE